MNYFINKVIIGLLLFSFYSACSSSNGESTKELVIGSIFWDDLSEQIKMDLFGAKLAAEEINKALVPGIKIRIENMSPSVGDDFSFEKGAENAKTLFDKFQPLALIHAGFPTIIALSNNEAKYRYYNQCMYLTSDSTINMPSSGVGDMMDVAYRTVVTDNNYLALAEKIIQGNQWKNIGLIRMATPHGDLLSLYLQLRVAELNLKLVYQLALPQEALDLEAQKAKLDELLNLSKTGGIDLLLLMSEDAQGPGLIKYLTENAYSGPMFVSAGAKRDDLFDIVKTLGSWIGGKNIVFGVEVDNYAGKNSEQFMTTFAAAYKQDPSYSTSPAYDCVYALALALLYAGPEKYTPLGIFENMSKFKLANRTTDEVEIGIGTAEFSKAAQVIQEGKRIDFQGASGRLLFDENGDRLKEAMQTFQINAQGNAWEIMDKYDENLNKVTP